MYPALSACEWRIEAPEGATIVFHFSSLQLEDHTGSNCRTAFDKVDIYDGNITTSNHMRTLCGRTPSDINSAFTSTGNIVILTFVSDSRVQAKGFHANYRFNLKTTTTPTTTTSTTTTSTTTEDSGLTMGDNSSSTNDATQSYPQSGNDVNSNASIHMAMVSQDKNGGKQTVELTAIFVEPYFDDKLNPAGERNESLATNGVTGKC